MRRVGVTLAFKGDSGHGKSSLIEAILNEEHLIPITGVRATTSVPTEFRSRFPQYPNHMYVAMIEIISQVEVCLPNHPAQHNSLLTFF